ncbi:metallophosphoesterase [Roseateles chitinivorans]|uniref:metallophosphoesterase n=1 Tax=Roseateles chitinivorans TaxID=2917965 RepID=UPI003D6666BB
MGSANMRNLGFRCIGQMDVSPFLPIGKKLRPTLCLSDTHLLPMRTSYGKDTPRDLLRLIEALPNVQLFVLGDFFESLMLSTREIAGLHASHRIGPLIEAIRCNLCPKIIPGNHDQRAITFVRRYYGKFAYIGGFRIGRLIFCHGHELGLDASHMAERFPLSIAVGGTLDRLGVGVPWGTVTNEAVGAHYHAMGLYAIFGHTHTPIVTRTYANTGCFLLEYRSCITIEEGMLSLWEGI